MDQKVPQGFNKETIMGMLKSKTIGVNTLLTIGILYLANTSGLPMTPDQAATFIPAIYAVVNIVLRFFTDKTLSDKGLTVQNPQKMIKLVEDIETNQEALEKLYVAMAKLQAARKKQREGTYTKAMRLEKERKNAS